MTVAIDTNILFDILLPDLEYKDRSLSLIIDYSKTDRLIISEIVYAELASQFSDITILKLFLQDFNVLIENTPLDGLWFAARAWKKYTTNKDKFLQCNQCGYKQMVKCDKCGEIITTRQHIISDFIIAGHAITMADKLITRDRGFYRQYFNNLIVDY
jgi:predicted nucleic acid-binding protein